MIASVTLTISFKCVKIDIEFEISGQFATFPPQIIKFQLSVNNRKLRKLNRQKLCQMRVVGRFCCC